MGKDNPEITLTYTGRANDGTEVNGTKVPSLAGIYTVTATIKDKNYSLKTEGASAAFIVAKAYPALSVSAVKDKKYGEEAFKLEVSNKGNGVKSYASSNDKVVTVDKNGAATIVGEAVHRNPDRFPCRECKLYSRSERSHHNGCSERDYS